MTDYISRKTAYQFFKDQLEEETGAYRKGRNAGLRVAMSAVMNNDAIPAADVRPVVLCRDCTFYKPQQKSKRWSSTTPMCSRSATIKMPPDGFCSFGVRKEKS